MGALSENRKRYPDLSPLSPPSKKSKISSPPSILHMPRYPPLAPLRRQVHGPQRMIKAFGLGSGRKSRICILAGPGSVMPVELEEDLELEDYRRLVVEVEEAVRSPEVKEVVRSPDVEEVVRSPEVELTTDEDVIHVDLEEATVPMEAEMERSRRRIVPLYKEMYFESGKKHDSRIRNLDFEVKLTMKKISGFRLVDEHWKKKHQQAIPEPFVPLTSEDEQKVDHAMRGGRRNEVLVVHEASSIEITREMLQCLNGNAWLNDEVINLYLELLKERERREPKKFLKCHFFNTFFYNKLISGKTGYDFKAVKRWTTQRKLGYNLIDCDKIFVPIHKQVHWCLAIINVKDKKFHYLDSLGGMDRMVLRTLARYLMDEVNDKSKKQIDTTSWKQESVDNLPLQENGWDCGMFMLKYTDFYSRGLGLDFGQEHMSYFRKRTAKEILNLRAE